MNTYINELVSLECKKENILKKHEEKLKKVSNLLSFLIEKDLSKKIENKKLQTDHSYSRDVYINIKDEYTEKLYFYYLHMTYFPEHIVNPENKEYKFKYAHIIEINKIDIDCFLDNMKNRIKIDSDNVLTIEDIE